MIGEDIALGIAQAGMGMALGNYNDARQMQQQKKLQALQIRGQKELGIFNREQAYKQWQDTNYTAQRRELQKAGLNVGLMYEGGGAGGTTSGTGAGSVTGGNAPAGGREVLDAIGMGLTMQMQKAQIENIKANTAKTLTETKKTGGVDTEQAQTAIEQMKLEMKGTEFENNIKQYEEQLRIIELNIADKNQQEAINQMAIATKRLNAEMEQAVTQAKISKESADSIIQLNKQNVTEQVLRMAGTKAGIQLTQEQIKKIGQEIMTQQVGLSQQERKLRLEQMMTEYNVGQGAEGKRSSETIKNYVNMLTDFLGAIMPNN